jgi:hypothetical protein
MTLPNSRSTACSSLASSFSVRQNCDSAARAFAARQQDRALDGLRPRIAEGRQHRARAGIFAIHRLFRIGAQPRHAGPGRKCIGGFGDLAAGDAVGAGGGDRPHQDRPVERVGGEIVAHDAGAGDIAGAERIEAAFQLRDRAAGRQPPGLDACRGRRLNGYSPGGDGGVDGRGARAGIGPLEWQRADRRQSRLGAREAGQRERGRRQQQQARGGLAGLRAGGQAGGGACVHGVSIPVPTRYEMEGFAATLAAGSEDGVNEWLAQPAGFYRTAVSLPLPRPDGETMVRDLRLG